MSLRWIPHRFVVLPFLALLLITGCGQSSTDTSPIDRHAGRLIFTRHARCRMDCRHITEKEVKGAVEKGEINYRKTQRNASPCPKYAVEEYVDGKRVRLIIGDCDEKAVVITVIDLDHEFECNCQGDEEK